MKKFALAFSFVVAMSQSSSAQNFAYPHRNNQSIFYFGSNSFSGYSIQSGNMTFYNFNGGFSGVQFPAYQTPAYQAPAYQGHSGGRGVRGAVGPLNSFQGGYNNFVYPVGGYNY